jgi:hypothetical protein
MLSIVSLVRKFKRPLERLESRLLIGSGKLAAVVDE